MIIKFYMKSGNIIKVKAKDINICPEYDIIAYNLIEPNSKYELIQAIDCKQIEAITKEPEF
jgi:hypothetical protein